MAELPNDYPKSYIQQATCCLGICRHCSDMIALNHSSCSSLLDVVLALEIAVMLLRKNHELAYDRLRYCAQVCNRVLATWENSLHPHYRQGVAACRAFVAFWQEEELRLTA